MVSKQEQVGLFIIRLGLGSFFLLWGLDKLFAPDSTIKIFDFFYLTSISVNTAYIVGVAEIIFSIIFLTGIWKRWTYGLGVLLHGVSTLSTWKQLLHPFGKNHLFIAALPILLALIALYIMRDQDTLWCLGTKRKKEEE
jgi:putative oxidoreductase